MKKELIKGSIVNFDNEKFCEEKGIDNLNCGHIVYAKQFGIMRFVTWFNGRIIHSSQTWKSSEKNMNKLFDKWNCEITIIEEPSN
tara:strand:- start:1518 stop:1772 length:255 start_codon:yes stop_codon:yes gene_type:complete